MLKRLKKHPAFLWVVGTVLSAYLKLVLVTSRTVAVTSIPAEYTGGAVVLAIWHQQLLAIPLVLKANPRPVTGLMSPSRDGKVIQHLAAGFGIQAAEGSSHKNGAQGLRQLVRATRGPQARTLFITPDGPRGPARQAKPGATEVARLTGLPLVPVAAWCTRKRLFNSWDRFLLPLPFTTFHIAYGTPLEELTPAHLAEILNTLTQTAQASAEGGQSSPRPIG